MAVAILLGIFFMLYASFKWALQVVRVGRIRLAAGKDNRGTYTSTPNSFFPLVDPADLTEYKREEKFCHS